MAWNAAEVNYFTMFGNMINTQDVWMFKIHIMKRLQTKRESEYNVKFVYLHIFKCSNASSMPLLRLNINLSQLGAENTFLLITAVPAAKFLYFEPSVYI